MLEKARRRALLRRFGTAVVSLAALAAPVGAETLTLTQAIQHAVSANASVRGSQAVFPALEGELAEARLPFFNNPQVSAEAGTRDSRQSGGPTASSRDWGIGIAQAFEIAGQQTHRRETVTHARNAAVANVEEVRARIIFEVSERFIRVLSLQTRIAAEERTLALIDRSAQAIARRFQEGEDSILDSNLARVEAERARNAVSALREQLIQAQAELATAVQWPAAGTIEAAGDLDEPARTYTLDQVVAAAARRPVLRVLELRESSARSRLALERSLAYPDVTLGLNHAREGPSDTRERVTTLTVSVPLPLFKRNQGGIGRATTELTQAQIERQSGIRLVEAQVRSLWARRQNLLERVRVLNQAVLPRLNQNQELTRKGFEAGELGLVQLLLANRQLVEAQRDLIDARTELRLANIALEAAAGFSPYVQPDIPATKEKP